MAALDPAERLARWSLATGVAVLLLKGAAWRLTGSVALLSDAMESIVNVVASFAMLFAVRIARLPADRNHPYGHGKAEYLSAVLEGLLIAVAAVLSIVAAGGRLVHPRALEGVGAGLAVSAFASALNGLLAWRLIAAGKALRSPALAADGRHVLSDVITTAGVLVGVGLARLTGWWRLDPLLACFVAVNILWMGWKLVRQSVGALMDEVLDEGEVARVRAVAERVAREGGAHGIEGFRLRRAGSSAHCDMTLVVPGEMAVRTAHALCDRIEDALRAEEPDLGVVVHVEPEARSSVVSI
ncbi:MAG: cobalt-zinc-cadmium resistance protein [Myxococcaceae bacterium]|nr:cobalt-zinc-cadmium resistance protein [Myxococcaceae bacterium]